MRPVGPGFIQIRPPQETPRPVPLPRLMVLTELIIIDRFIRLVQRIRPVWASIIRQSRRDANSCPGQQQRLAILDR